MRSPKTARWLLVASLVVGLCSGGGLAQSAFRVNLMSDLTNADPAQYTIGPDRVVGHQVLQGLVEYDYTSSESPLPIVPVLAESYEVADDGRSITFHLRRGVQFHHGYGEFTSEDAAFSIMRHLDPAVASRARLQLLSVEGAETPDPYTLRLVLNDSSAYTVLAALAWQDAGHVLSKKAVEALGDGFQSFPVGTGPWQFEENIARQRVALSRFEDYWGTKPGYDQLVFRIIPDFTTALVALEAGDLDVVQLEARGSVELAATVPGTHIVWATQAADLQRLYFYHDKEPMNNVLVRKALHYAIDIDVMAVGMGPQITRMAGPMVPAVGGVEALYTYQYDPEYARQLLADAGYADGFTMTMIYYVGHYFEPFAMWLQRFWEDIGVDVEVVVLERGVYGANVATGYDGRAHAAVWGLTRMAPYFYAERFLSTSPPNVNIYRYSNPEVDHAVNRAATALSPEAAAGWYNRAMQLVVEDAVGVWLVGIKAAVAVRDGIEGVVPLPMSGVVDYRSIRPPTQ